MFRLLFFVLAFPFALQAQTPSAGGDAKYWVVLLVLALIFAGLFAFLFALERKLTALERREFSDED